MTDPTFRNFIRLLAQSFNDDEIDPTRSYFDKNYMPLVEVKDFNA